MNIIRSTCGLLLFFTLFCCLAAGCSNEKLSRKTFTVGVVNLNEDLDKVFFGFRKEMAELGYEEGKNIIYIYKGARSEIPDLENDLKSLIEQKVDLILSITTPATKKAKEFTEKTGLPVVFAPVFDPVDSGIVQSLLNPGGNITGIKVGGHSGKALEWLLRIAPDIKKIFVPFSSNNEAALQSLKGLQEAADKAGVQLAVQEVSSRKDLTFFLNNLPEGTDALWLLNSHFLVHHSALFVDAAIKYRLPLGSSTSQVDDGVMVTYGQDAFRTGELAAWLAHKILQGSSPASLPVDSTDYFLGINLKTADSIGIDISNDILHVADTIIR